MVICKTQRAVHVASHPFPRAPKPHLLLTITHAVTHVHRSRRADSPSLLLFEFRTLSRIDSIEISNGRVAGNSLPRSIKNVAAGTSGIFANAEVICSAKLAAEAVASTASATVAPGPAARDEIDPRWESDGAILFVRTTSRPAHWGDASESSRSGSR